jgi:hypothetical protein
MEEDSRWSTLPGNSGGGVALALRWSSCQLRSRCTGHIRQGCHWRPCILVEGDPPGGHLNTVRHFRTYRSKVPEAEVGGRELVFPMHQGKCRGAVDRIAVFVNALRRAIAPLPSRSATTTGWITRTKHCGTTAVNTWVRH